MPRIRIRSRLLGFVPVTAVQAAMVGLGSTAGWKLGRAAWAAIPPTPAAATATGDTLSLRAPDATGADGGRETPVTMRWTGVLEDDRIRGILYLIFPGGDAPPRRWEAERREG